MLPTKQEQKIIGRTADRLGQVIVLEKERWNHILEGHPELEGLELALMRVVENPDKRRHGNYNCSEKLSAKGLGPATWLTVVVEYDGLDGRIVTAYPESKEPRSG